METLDKEKFVNNLLNWDQKHTDFLKSIYAKNVEFKDFINLIIELFLTDERLELPTSWLIKHHIDQQETLTNKDLERILSQLHILSLWGSQLHLLQIISRVQLTKSFIGSMEYEIRKKLKSRNKFVRAAAFEAYFEVVKLFPELKSEFKMICLIALESESASVKVKIKRILKKKGMSTT